jgi:extradiol dioxygenase family protein
MQTFHLALPVDDLDQAKRFYRDVLGLEERRSAFNWVDFDFFGHQLSLHLVTRRPKTPESCAIDGDQVPSRHFGIVLDKERWSALRDSLAEKGQKFLIGPRLRFEGKDGEQGTLFVADPAGNYLEFKYFSDTSRGIWY